MRTGYRLNELASLRVSSLGGGVFAASGMGGDAGGPAVVRLPGRLTKNGKAGSVPIPGDLAEALVGWVRDERKLAGAALFWVTKGKRRTRMETVEVGGALVKRQVYAGPGGAKWRLREDMRGAGLGGILDLPGLVVDFHSLRATAITWWLEGHVPGGRGLDANRVMKLAAGFSGDGAAVCAGESG